MEELWEKLSAMEAINTLKIKQHLSMIRAVIESTGR